MQRGGGGGGVYFVKDVTVKTSSDQKMPLSSRFCLLTYEDETPSACIFFSLLASRLKTIVSLKIVCKKKTDTMKS